MANAVGCYEGDHFGGRHTICLKADGSFTQEYRRAGIVVFQATGKWSIESKDTVLLRPFIGFQGDPAKPAEPTTYLASFATWSPFGPALVWGGDHPWSVTKQ